MFRYYSTRDDGVHFSIHERRRGEWIVRVAFSKEDLMTGNGSLETVEDTLREAREYVTSRIAVLEGNIT